MFMFDPVFVVLASPSMVGLLLFPLFYCPEGPELCFCRVVGCSWVEGSVTKLFCCLGKETLLGSVGFSLCDPNV